MTARPIVLVSTDTHSPKRAAAKAPLPKLVQSNATQLAKQENRGNKCACVTNNSNKKGPVPNPELECKSSSVKQIAQSLEKTTASKLLTYVTLKLENPERVTTDKIGRHPPSSDGTDLIGECSLSTVTRTSTPTLDNKVTFLNPALIRIPFDNDFNPHLATIQNLVASVDRFL